MITNMKIQLFARLIKRKEKLNWEYALTLQYFNYLMSLHIIYNTYLKAIN